MVIYSITYFLNTLGILGTYRQRKYLNYIVVALLIFMSGTRYYMGGSDVYIYEGLYNNVASVGSVLQYMFTGVNNGINTNYEIGYTLLCSVCKMFGFSYFGFILIWSLLFYTLLIKGLKEFVPNWGVFWAFFMYKLLFYDTFISIRQGLTIAIFCCMLRYLRDRKWLQYFLLTFVAFLEHRGAIILFPLYFITYLPLNKKFIMWYAVLWLPTWFLRSYADLTGVLTFLASSINNEHALTHWIESVETINIIHTLECYAIIVCVVVFYDVIMENERSREAKLALQLLLVAVPIFTLFSEWIVLTREKDYFVLMYGIVLGYIIEGQTRTSAMGSEYAGSMLVGNKKNRIILAMVVIVACFIGMYRYVRVFDGGVLMNFESWLFRASMFR